MRIYALTWNTHGHNRLPKIALDADIIFISLQECYARPDTSGILLKHRICIAESFYGLQTIVLSTKQLAYKVKKIGFGRFGLPNKGFIGICINGSFLHINAHLAPHDYNQELRMRQIRRIFEYTHEESLDTIVLTGDLNFRTLDGHEQSQAFSEAYKNFKEAEIHFKPTYKYDEKEISAKRAPSFCDRVFVASRHDIRFIKYSSMQGVILSDHKPVYLLFELVGKKTACRLLAVPHKNHTALQTIGQAYQWLWIGRRLIILGLIALYIMYTVCLMAGIKNN